MLRRALTVALLVCAGSACTTRPTPSADAGAGVDAGVDPWRLVLSGLPGTLLSAWESPDGVLYAVGGTSTSALVLRHDAAGWWVMDSGTNHALWWVHGSSASDVYAVGAEGVVTHFDGSRWTVLREGGDFTLFGAWGASSSQLVAVGGVVTSSAPRAAIVSKTSGWGELGTEGLPPGRALFKVWGAAANDLFVVGEGGLVARGVPGAWTVLSAPTTERLTTIHGAGAEVYAVGGLREPVLLRLDHGAWRALPVSGSPQLLNGVAVNRAGEVVLVGLDGYLAEGQGDDFVVRPLPVRSGLHGVAVTGSGFVAVGGDLLGAFGRGVLLSRGPLEPGALKTWPQPGTRWDAGVPDAGEVDAGEIDAGEVDAGEIDAGEVDAGEIDAGPPLGPGELCEDPLRSCAPGLNCWFVFGPFHSWCGATCTDVSECGASGPGACCKLPGPQVSVTVCLPEAACDAGS